MAIPYRTAKFKSVNTFAMAIWDPTAKLILIPANISSYTLFPLNSLTPSQCVSQIFVMYL